MKRLVLLLLCLAVLLSCFPAFAEEQESVLELLLSPEKLNTPTPVPTPTPVATPKPTKTPKPTRTPRPTPTPTPAPVPAHREEGLKNEYPIILLDECDLLTAEEEADLLEIMRPLSKYGAVAFWTTWEKKSVDSKQVEFYDEMISPNRSYNGTIFFIDMYNREIVIFSRGDNEKTVNRANAYAITKDVSHYATDKQYYTCALKAFTRIHALLQGEMMASPMRIICSVFAGMMAGLMATLLIVKKVSIQRLVDEGAKTSLRNLKVSIDYNELERKKTSTTKTPRSSDSSCSSCGSRSSGGGRSSGGSRSSGGGRSGGSGGRSRF